jgi:hypothetical protein
MLTPKGLKKLTQEPSWSYVLNDIINRADDFCSAFVGPSNVTTKELDQLGTLGYNINIQPSRVFRISW